jgi:drug/metabolite transporter, DME family
LVWGLILFLTPKLQSNSNHQTTYLIGLFFAFLSACVTLSYAVLFKHYSEARTSLNPIAVACTTFAIGSVLLAPISVVISPHLISKLTQSHSLSVVLGLGIFSTVVPTFCYSYAAKQLPPILTTTLNLLTPVFAALIAFFWLHEHLPLISILGATLVLVGIMTLSIAKPKLR